MFFQGVYEGLSYPALIGGVKLKPIIREAEEVEREDVVVLD